MKSVVFETVGTGHYLDNYRCGGSKPWGGGEVTHRAELSAKDIITALENTQHGRAALSDYVKRQGAARQPPGCERKPLAIGQILDLPVWKTFVGLMPEHKIEFARAIEAVHSIKGDEA